MTFDKISAVFSGLAGKKKLAMEIEPGLVKRRTRQEIYEDNALAEEKAEMEARAELEQYYNFPPPPPPTTTSS
jgi:hypothetical protein